MAGMAGFEPTNTGVKVLCLTTWRHPNINQLYSSNHLYGIGYEDYIISERFGGESGI